MRLARSEQSEHQAFRYGERAWGLQFHPEVDLPLYLGWIKNWEGAPERMGLDPDALEASVAAGSPALHRAALRRVLLGLRRRGELTRQLRGSRSRQYARAGCHELCVRLSTP